MREYQEGEIILCTVIDVVKTNVFVETADGVKGSIVFSEIAPGRIRNIRDYVVPKKIIACKILSIRDNHLFLSLRRVKGNEKKDLMEQNKKEKTYESIVKKITGAKFDEIIDRIKKIYSLTEFFDQAKENSKILEKYFSDEEIQHIEKILKEKKVKEKEVKKEFKLSCKQPNGIKIIKSILSQFEDVYYLGGSKFMVKRKSENLKKSTSEINNMIEVIEKQAKKEKCFFEVRK